ncbi:unnamed protein product [Heterobilharzia americana]|nr:unnamed protein product [Heterobilharzia americana]CAH8553877.1 unnamed protein product [Heterobilharzia americana]
MQRPPTIPIVNRSSLTSRPSGNILNSVTPCKEYYTHDLNGKLKYCIEVDLQGYPQESIQITRQSQDVTISLNYEERKATGEKYKQEFKREIQFPLSADLNTLKCTIISKNTLLLEADVNKPENSILKVAQVSPVTRRHINWELSNPSQRNSVSESPKLRTSFSNETKHRYPSLPNSQIGTHKSFRLKERGLTSQHQRIPHRRSPTHYTANSFSRHESLRIPVRVDINHQRIGQPSPTSVQPIRVEVVNHSPQSKQYNRPHQSQSQPQSQQHNNHSYNRQSEYKMSNSSTITSQRPLQINPVANMPSDESIPKSSTTLYHPHSHHHNGNTNNGNHINSVSLPINHIVTASNNNNITSNTVHNNTSTFAKSSKFYTQSMKVGSDVKPDDLNIHLKNGVLTIMIRQRGKNFENNQQTKIAREFLHEHTMPINVDQSKLIAKLDKGVLTWEAPYTSAQIDLPDCLNIPMKGQTYPVTISR